MTQETFLRAIRSRGSFRGDSTLFTWLCGILVNRCRLERRRRRVRSWLSLDWAIEKRADRRTQADSKTPSRRLQQIETESALWRAIEGLSDHQRAVLVLVHFEGLPAREAAQVLSTSEAAIWKALSRAREGLRRSMRGHL